MKTLLQWLLVAVATVALIVTLEEIHMTAPAEATHGSILQPYSSLARLFAATDKWKELTGEATEDAAMSRLSYPDYSVIPTDGGLFRVPAIVISNPIDLSATIYKKPDPQGRRDFGALLVSFLMARDDDTDNALAIFMHDVEQLIDQARAKADRLNESETLYYRNISHFELAIAAGQCDLANIKGMAFDDDSEDPDPLIVMSTAYVAHWI